MTYLIIGSVLLGAVFGRFFKVWVLVPACALTFAIVSASCAYYQHGLTRYFLGFAVIAACLQAGYVSSCLLGVIRDSWRRLTIPREISRESPHPAVTRHRQLF